MSSSRIGVQAWCKSGVGKFLELSQLVKDTNKHVVIERTRTANSFQSEGVYCWTTGVISRETLTQILESLLQQRNSQPAQRRKG